MKVITSNPVRIQTPMATQIWDSYHPFAGLESSDQVKAFQDWMDAKHPNWVNGSNLNKGKGYGNVKGPTTEKMYNQYKSEYNKYLASAGASAGTPSSSPRITEASPTGEKRKGQVYDRMLGAFVKAKESGLLDTLGNIADRFLPGKTGGEPTQQEVGPGPAYYPEAESSGGMNKTTKILIGVGSLVLLGAIIYSVTKKSKSTK